MMFKTDWETCGGPTKRRRKAVGTGIVLIPSFDVFFRKPDAVAGSPDADFLAFGVLSSILTVVSSTFTKFDFEKAINRRAAESSR